MEKTLHRNANVLPLPRYGVAFYFHSHMPGKEPLEEAVHMVPITAMVGAGLAMMYEHKWRRGIWTLLIRSYFVLTLGTWFSHVAFMLYVHDRFPGERGDAVRRCWGGVHDYPVAGRPSV